MYEFKYIHKLRPKKRAVQLERGSWIHELLMVHYDGHDWLERHLELTTEFNRLFEEEREDLGNLPAECGRIMRSYLHHYQEEDTNFRVVDSELDELIALPGGDEFNFIIDLIVEDKSDGGLWLWDHKTVKGFMPPDFMLLDAQLARYFWAAEKMGYTPLRGVMFNELITKPPTVPKLLKSGKFEERANLFCDALTYYETVKSVGQDPRRYATTIKRLRALEGERFFRRTSLPKDKPLTKRLMQEMMMTIDEIKVAEEKNRFPRTPDKSCQWGCDYLEPCVIELHGGDISDVAKLKYVTGRRDED